MKIILDLQNINPSEIEKLKFDKDSNTISFIHKNKKFYANVQESIGTFIKEDKNENIELINYEAVIE